MKPSHVLLLLLTTMVWGFNFVAIRVGLDHVPPLTFTALRFIGAVVPAIFFVKKPDLPWHKLIAYGLVMFAAQFAFLFSAMNAGLSAGLAALIIQVQAFFTIAIAAFLLREKPLPFQVIGAGVAFCGLAVVGLHVGGDVTVLGLLFAVLAAFSWSCGNILTKTFGKVNVFGVVVWGSLFASLPLLILAGLIEGPDVMVRSIAGMRGPAFLALGYNIYASTFIGYTLWNRMLSHYPAAMVVPFTLLVPAFAMISAALMLGESYAVWKFEATILILCGLALNQFGSRAWMFIGGVFRPSQTPP